MNMNYKKFKDCAPLEIGVAYVFDSSLGSDGEFRPLTPSDLSGGGGGGSGGDASASNQEIEIERLESIESTLEAINTKTVTQTKGQNTMVNSHPVVIASNQSAIPVSSTTLATAAHQETQNTSLTNILNKVPVVGQAAMAASLPVVIANNQSAVPVSSTTFATVTNQTTHLTRLGNTTDAAVSTQDTNGSLIALTKGIITLLNGIQSPKNAVSVLPSDTVDIVGSVLSLWVGTGGDISVQTSLGSVLFKNVPNGTKLDIQAIRVNETDTTAGDVVALLK